MVDIPDANIRTLDELAAKSKRSRAAEIRDAIEDYITAKADRAWILEGFGYWKDRDDIGDAVDYQRAIREDRSDPRA